MLCASNSYDATIIALNALANSISTNTSILSYIQNTVHNTQTFGNTKFNDVGGVSKGEFLVQKIRN